MEADDCFQNRRLEVLDGFPTLVIGQMARVRVDPLFERPRVRAVAEHVLVVVGLEQQDFAALEPLLEQRRELPCVGTHCCAVAAVIEDEGHGLGGVVRGLYRCDVELSNPEALSRFELSAAVTPHLNARPCPAGRPHWGCAMAPQKNVKTTNVV
jgi:hypothetical protein